jgi:hypothetical protein
LRKGIDVNDRPFPRTLDSEGSKYDNSDLRWYYKKLKISRASAVVLFEDSDSANFSNLIALMQYFESNPKKNKRIKCSIQCIDYGMNKVISSYIDEQQRYT